MGIPWPTYIFIILLHGFKFCASHTKREENPTFLQSQATGVQKELFFFLSIIKIIGPSHV